MAIPKYMATMHGLLNYIGEKQLSEGDALPPEPVLAEYFRVSVITLRHAVKALQEQGVVERRHGSGTYVRSLIAADSIALTIAFVEVTDPGYANGVKFNPVTVRQRFALAGVRVKFIAVEREPDSRNIAELKSVGGIVITGWADARWMQILRSFNVPLMTVGQLYDCDVSGLINIVFDWEAMAYRACLDLLGQGHRSLGIILPPLSYAPSREMIAGVRRAAAEREPNADLHLCEVRDGSASADVHAFLEAHPDLDALVVECNSQPFVLEHMLKTRRSWRIGVLSVSCYYEPYLENVVEYSFRDNIYDVAAKTFFDYLRGEYTGIDTVRIPCRCTRES